MGKESSKPNLDLNPETHITLTDLPVESENETEFSFAIHISRETAAQIRSILADKDTKEVIIFEYLLDPDQIRNSKLFSDEFKNLAFVQAAKKARLRIYENGKGQKCVLAFKGPQQAGEKDEFYKKSERSEDSILITDKIAIQITGGKAKTKTKLLKKLSKVRHAAVIGFSQRERHQIDPQIASIAALHHDLVGFHIDIFHPPREDDETRMIKIDFETENRQALDQAWNIKEEIARAVFEQLQLPSLRASKQGFAAKNWKSMNPEDDRTNPAKLLH